MLPRFDFLRRLFAALVVGVLLSGANGDLLSAAEPIGSFDVRHERDVTTDVEVLGVASSRGPYARNIWDLLWFDGRLFVATGNSSNVGPDRNAGPTPVFAYLPAEKRFVEEYVLPEEQIDRFRVLDGRLWIAGHDPRQGWELGNVYYRDGGDWHKRRTVPRGLHTYDLAIFQGQLIAALGTDGTPTVATSTDDGQSWSVVAESGAARRYGLSTFQGRVFAWGAMLADPNATVASRDTRRATFPLEFDGEKWDLRTDLNADALFPHVENRSGLWRISRDCVLKDRLLYIAGPRWNDHHTYSLALFAADSLRRGDVQTRRVKLPADTTPWDVEVRGEAAYLLTSTPVDDGAKFVIRVWKSEDGLAWRSLIRLTQPTFARSLEIVDGDVYLGLGTDVGRENAKGNEAWRSESYTPTQSAESGTLLRIRGFESGKEQQP